MNHGKEVDERRHAKKKDGQKNVCNGIQLIVHKFAAKTRFFAIENSLTHDLSQREKEEEEKRE